MHRARTTDTMLLEQDCDSLVQKRANREAYAQKLRGAMSISNPEVHRNFSDCLDKAAQLKCVTQLGCLTVRSMRMHVAFGKCKSLCDWPVTDPAMPYRPLWSVSALPCVLLVIVPTHALPLRSYRFCLARPLHMARHSS